MWGFLECMAETLSPTWRGNDVDMRVATAEGPNSLYG
jgi:hypothetical protein